LTAERDAGVGQEVAGRTGLRGELLGVGEVEAEPQRAIFLEHPEQTRGDALRQHHRHLGSDADHLHVGNTHDPGQDEVQLAVRQGQRVAAGDEDVPDGGGLLDIGDGLLPLGDAAPEAA